MWQGEIHLYAYDGTLQVVSKDIRTIELKLTDAFGKIVNWMKLKNCKTKVQLIGSYKRVKKNTNVNVKYENQILEQVSSYLEFISRVILLGKTNTIIYAKRSHKKLAS